MIADVGTEPPLVLFLGSGNAAVAMMAEAIIRHLARKRVRVASAADSLAPCSDPYALACLRAHGIETTGLRNRAWGEFFGVEKPPVRLLITLGNVYAAESNWQGNPLVANWDMPDPAALAESEVDVRLSFEEAFVTLHARIEKFLALPLERLDDRALSQKLACIGAMS